MWRRGGGSLSVVVVHRVGGVRFFVATTTAEPIAAIKQSRYRTYCHFTDVRNLPSIRQHGLLSPEGDAWFAAVAEVFKRHECKWGGDWTSRDLPHFQWGRCRASPSAQARALVETSGIPAVWAAVGAD